MIIKRKTIIIFALMVMNVFLFQNCATIIRGTSQKIPVTSNPIGAKIIVDGKEMGYTPMNLKLKRKKGHVIRIEKQNYNPLEIRIARKTSALSVGISILGNYLGAQIGFLVGYAVGYAVGSALKGEARRSGVALGICGFFVGSIGAIYMDFKSGANYTLSPKELNVTLSIIEGKPHPNFILIDAEKFQDIKWIRIKFVDSEEEEIVNLD